MSQRRIRFRIGVEETEIEVADHHLLIDVLRDALGLTGTKDGCGVGICGACSVLVDGRLMTACLLPALHVEGKVVETIETLTTPGKLSALQDAFIRYGGFQCGICTPGQIVAATALLREEPKPSAEQVREWMTGNLCRCTGYYKIVTAILAAAEAQPAAGSILSR